MARGGKRDGAGRKPGVRNALTIEKKATIAELAQKHAPMALRTLAEICENGKSETARIQAANVLLERGYGRAAQQIDLNPTAPLVLNVYL
jgi:hypothetical protein